MVGDTAGPMAEGALGEPPQAADASSQIQAQAAIGAGARRRWSRAQVMCRVREQRMCPR